ncbi:Ppx/GppA phosphatase [Abditibacterium utsteinense]|uniref:Ppx/GppA phosphatase n=1 Tax=Abditibacterium utsteinense TaxID=1960156 RepID=A0A2S8SRW8_9BACT|nr:Ppx/GppA phosphatase family protein [Abditibacterium utsteinense]PQV63562.1 Ppx/GppA phosphatase [Abditibacterium utsteinense]
MPIRTLVPTPRRTAIIDLGSNSARVVVMNGSPGFSYHLEDEIREIVRLREGMTSAGLSAAAMARGLGTLRLFKQFCDSLEVDHIIATATSAVREAANGPQFLERVESETGLHLRILEGDEEAYYGVLGALGAVPLENGVVVDIGGGSAQISQIKDRRFLRGQALTLGALALTQRFVRSDPIKKSEIKAVQTEIERQLDEVSWLRQARAAEGSLSVVGLGGTIRNLAKIEAARQKFPLQSVNGMQLSLDALDETIRQLSEFPLAQRKRIPGLVRDRADIILPGALVIRAILARLGQNELLISEAGLREGLFFEEFWRDLPYPVVPDLRVWSVLNLARFAKYQEAHTAHVGHISRRLFDQLAPLHGYGEIERQWLDAAAILHDIGILISYNDHHKHSQTLIVSSGLPGYSPREVALISLIARYHRKGAPAPGAFAALLEAGDETKLQHLAAILRLAEYLERGRSGIVRDVTVRFDAQEIHITLMADENPTVELWVARRSGLDLMESAFGRKIILESAAV